MDPDPDEEWHAMRADQATLRARLDALDVRLARFERAKTPALASPPLPTPPPLPVMPVAVPATAPAPAPAPVTSPVAWTAAATAPPPVARESMEMRIGTDWLVRAGVVLLLTSLAFLGDYLYHHVVPHLGPGAKIALLYLGAGTLAGVGAWLERSRSARENAKVHNYAGVLLAGGLAAVYYVTYAAHYNPNLRVIGSPLLAGSLLLGWTVFMVWVADRRRSETVATFAILLAFYTSAVNEVAGFTLVSNLPLAAGAVWLMRRHLWRIFPFVSLLATFGSYAYWRYFHLYASWQGLPGAATPLHALSTHGFRVETAFLLLYWLLFTWTVFSTSDTVLPVARRAGFVTLNNGAFFLLATWSVLEHYPDAFWKWSLVFGGVLLTLAEVCRRLPERTGAATESAYQLGGVLLATLGFVTYFTGWRLGLMLTAESTALLVAAGYRKGPVLIGAAMLTAAGGFVLILNELDVPATGHFKLLAPVAGAIFIFNGWQGERLAAREPGWHRPWVVSAWFELLALGLGLMWGVQYFPANASFSYFALAGGVVFVLGLETRRARWLLWSYALTSAALAVSWLSNGDAEHRHPLQLLGIACLVVEQQFGRRGRGVEAAVRGFPAPVPTAMMIAAVVTGWVSLSAGVMLWQENGFLLAASWSIYAVAVFAGGLALRERTYRLLALGVLAGTFGHIALVDIWNLDSLQRFFSLLCLGLVLMGIGFFYTRYASWLKNIF